LTEVGFEVEVLENQSRVDLLRKVQQFGDRIRQSNAIAVFYYAGHGVQLQGVNYLIPLDAAIEREDDVANQALDLNVVLRTMEAARNPLNIVILDACRDNPFPRSFRTRQSGLAPLDAPTGMLIAFATAPGAVAADGDGTNGTYTKHLLRNLAIPGLPVELMFKRVREGVMEETRQRQVPWESSSLVGEFAFKFSASGTPLKAQIDPASIELGFWQSIKDSGHARDFSDYLKQYPDGVFSALAKERLEAARRASKQPAVQANSAQPSDSPDKALKAKVGDNWTYALLEKGKRQIDLVTFTLVEIDGDEAIEVASLAGDGGQLAKRRFPLGFQEQGDYQELSLLDRFVFGEFSPYVLPDDLRGGRTIALVREVPIRFDRSGEAPTVQLQIRSITSEVIRVPAGKFKAVRVEATARNPASRGELLYTYWYSPDVRRVVKISRRYSVGEGKVPEDTLELYGYKQSR